MLVQLYIPASFFFFFKYHKNILKIDLDCIECLLKNTHTHTKKKLDVLIDICFYEYRGVRR